MSELLGIEKNVCDDPDQPVLIVFNHFRKRRVEVMEKFDMRIRHLRLDDSEDLAEALFEGKRPEVDL